jgi:penicillin-binding protein 1C
VTRRRLSAWLLLAALALLPPLAAAQPSFEAVRAAHRPSDLPLLDRHGAVLQRVRVDTQVRRGDWVALAEVSPALRQALVLGEDRRFWQHGGVDWAALAAGAWAAAFDEKARGASTITMQLAALLDPALARPAGGRGVVDKLAQLRAARRLEARWSKTQILEAYLNAVPLRGELVGLRAASLQLFGKQPSGLDAVEAALLAVLVRAPNAPPPRVQRRACELLRLQQRGCEGIDITWAQALARPPGPMLPAGTATDEAGAPHLARTVLRGYGAAPPAALPSTLDARVQRLALATLRRQLAELRGRGVEDGAVVVLDNASGEVLAWVGSAGRGSQAAAFDAVLARRQPGSTIKPFVYGLALERRLLTPASVLDDRPLALGGADGVGAGALYRPRNYDEAFRGPVSVREALAASLNVPAVQVGAMLGPDAVFDGLVRAGLDPARHAGWHGHALVLGSADTTLLALANAYRALANGGRWSPPRWTAPAALPAWARAAPRPLLPPAVAWQLGHVLSDAAARGATFGLDSPLVTRGFAAVKTGTSKDLRDNWCIGFSDRFTVGVWVGNAGGAPMHGVSGSEGAAPVWRELVEALHQGRPSRAPPPPAGLVARGGEWFIAGTEPAGAALQASRPLAPQAFGIAWPREGAVIVLDPGIPAAAQRLVFEGEAGLWRLGGRALGRGARVAWLPRPGRHVVELHTAAGVQRLRFEVRAAPPPRHPGSGSPGPG